MVREKPDYGLSRNDRTDADLQKAPLELASPIRRSHDPCEVGFETLLIVGLSPGVGFGC